MGLLNEWLDYLEQWVGRGAYVYSAQGQRANEVGNVKAWIERKSKSRETAKLLVVLPAIDRRTGAQRSAVF